jgi:hypothetical protein
MEAFFKRHSFKPDLPGFQIKPAIGERVAIRCYNNEF